MVKSHKGKKRSFKKKSVKKFGDKNKMKASTHMPFEPRYITKFTQVGAGFISSANARQNYFIQTGGNMIVDTFANNSNELNTGVSQNVTDMTSDTAFGTALPMGWSLLTTIYKQYRVSGCKIRITVSPQTSGDALLLAVFPCTESSAVTGGFLGTGGAVSPSAGEAGQMPYAKSRVCTGNNNQKQNTIEHYMTTSQINGLTKSQYKNDIVNGVSISQNPIITAGNQSLDLPWFWGIAIGAMDNSNFAANVTLEIQLTFYVTLTNPISVIA